MPKANSKQRQQVAAILKDMALINRAGFVGKDGNLDIDAFNKDESVIAAKKELTEIGVTSKWLQDNGFMLADMILRFDK